MEPGTLLDRLVSMLAEATDGGAGLLVGALQTVAIAVGMFVAARLIRRNVHGNLTRTSVDPNIAALATNLAVVAIYALGITLMLGVFGASWSAMLTVIGAGTIALSLALQDLLKSYVAGVYLLLERPFAVGDRIRVKDVEGEVEGIELRSTLLRTPYGDVITVPNATVFAEVVTNRSARQDDRTIVLLTKLSDPLAEIPDLVSAALSPLAETARQPPVIEVLSSSEAGAGVAVTLFHPPGEQISARALTALRDAFPNAELTIERD